MQIERSTEAQRDVDEIWLHIATENSLDVADAILKRIDHAFQKIAEYPLIGRERDELAIGVRSVPVSPFLVLYRVHQDHVLILCVVHGSRELPDLL